MDNLLSAACREQVCFLPNIPSISLFRQHLPILKRDLAPQDNLSHFAFDLPALEGSPAAAGELVSGFYFVFGGLVHFDPGFGLFGEVEDAARVDDTLLNQVV